MTGGGDDDDDEGKKARSMETDQTGSPMHISTPRDAGPVAVRIQVDVDGAPAGIRDGLAHLAAAHTSPYFGNSSAEHVWNVRFEHDDTMDEGAYTVRAETTDAVRVVVRYARATEAFRALGQVATAARAAEVGAEQSVAAPEFTISENAQFERLALMVDCSRNGVMTVESVQALSRQMALMGYTMLQLYTEDTFRVPAEPFFGYLRGGFSQAELRAIDDYAWALGIEVVPCIQTLGHLGQMLQWPRYAGLRDTNEVILARQPETYALLDKLIATVSAPLRSSRIHIGMDEAYGVAEGRFRALHGAVDGAAVFVEHLARVNAICQRHGLRPMIWSDMLFCLAAKSNALYAYYDQANAADGLRGIPPDVDLVFWDYYHTQPDIYTRKIQQHRELGCASPWVAAGAWTWSRLWCYLPFSFESTRASLAAAKSADARVQSFMLTIWGDEGNECDFFSALPAMLYVANHAYTDCSEIDPTFMENSFAAICGGSLGDWMYACRLDEIPQSGAPEVDLRAQLPSNMSKWMLWEDPMLAFMSPQYAGLPLDSHFTQIADRLLSCALAPSTETRYPLNRLLRLPGLLARVLALKCGLRERLAQPYRMADRAGLLQQTETRLRPLIEAQRELWLYHRARWMRIYKPFGWETLELRYGGLTARLQSMYDRIVAYALNQPCSSLRRSRAIGVAAGISRHPALLPSRSRNPSLVASSLQPPPSATLAEDVVLPGPSMSADNSEGMSVGDAPAWLATAATCVPTAPMAAETTATVGLGWPVTAAAATAATSPPIGPSPPHEEETPATTMASEAGPVVTALPEVTTINALGVRELGGEGDFWLQPAPLLPPELDAHGEEDPPPAMGIGCLGEQDAMVVDSIPELEEELHCIYENSYTSLLLDYGRVTTPSRLG
ncbi:hypothetical protein GGF46_002340 [Coemansia sp. RSA 552]|nr:hypothetical protein GGF46_002340 [Coemansia sp. RSA 552]